MNSEGKGIWRYRVMLWHVMAFCGIDRIVYGMVWYGMV